VSVPSETSETSGTAGSALVTTGQAARLCAVTPRTIARWVDAGLVRSHRTAGGRRRMLRSDVLAFMRQHGMPMPATGARIAVVDDDPQIVRSLRRALVRLVPGADCRTAHDGFTAGALLTSFRPDLVFLDVVMPGLSGVEVCQYIRSTPELTHTAIAIISGHLTDELRARLVAVGADRIIAKPFTTADVEAALAAHVLTSTAAEREGRG
jgi:excisionase family DNA binding protein